MNYVFPDWCLDQKEKIEKLVKEINEALDDIAYVELDEIYDKKSIRHKHLLQICGVVYIPVKLHLGVIKEHEHSEAIATFELLQVPSADTYFIEANQVYIEIYKVIIYAQRYALFDLIEAAKKEEAERNA